jgi:hypothetical protein
MKKAILISFLFVVNSLIGQSTSKFQVGLDSKGILRVKPYEYRLLNGVSIGWLNSKHAVNLGVYLHSINTNVPTDYEGWKLNSGYLNYSYSFPREKHPRITGHLMTEVGFYHFERTSFEIYDKPYEIGTIYQSYFLSVGYGYRFNCTNDLAIKLTPNIGYFTSKETELKVINEFYNRVYNKQTEILGSINFSVNLSIHYSFPFKKKKSTT